MGKWRILIADDELRIRDLLRMFLEACDFEVYSAVDGVDAVSKIKEKKPHLLLLDIRMPKMGGLDVCKQIRQDERYRELPVIYLSSKSEKYEIIEGLDSGGDDYITKPFDPNEVIARVNAMLRRLKVDPDKQTEMLVEYEELSEQEMKIIVLMEQGYTNQEIANQLFLTIGTIKVYNYVIYQKLRVKNRTQAIVRAKELYMI